jgi:hypothetical protein
MVFVVTRSGPLVAGQAVLRSNPGHILAGVYRGMVDDAVRSVLGVAGVSRAANVTYLTTQVRRTTTAGTARAAATKTFAPRPHRGRPEVRAAGTG